MANGTVLDFNLIKAHVGKLESDYDVLPSQAFIYTILQQRLGLDDFDTEDSFIDGSNDCGIDAIYIDESDTERPRVYLIQSKYYQSIDKFDRSFEGAALTKMSQAVNDLILNIPHGEAYMSDKLKNKLNDIRNLQNPIFSIIFTSNSNHPSEAAKERFHDFLDRVSNGQDFFDVEYLHLSEISKLLAPEKTKTINAKLRLSGSYLTADSGVARTLIGKIAGVELAKLRESNGIELFDRNVRGYLSKSNEVNKKIYASSTSDDAYQFFFLNNGLTVVCSKYKYLPTAESPEIEIDDLQIVNGGQTTNSLYEAYQKGLLKDQVNVLIRIIETEDRGLLERITESTNTQTLVNARDLRSNDPIQKKIESFLAQKDYYYEARANKFKGKQLNDRRVDAVKAAQAYYAFGLQKPADAKNKKRNLFGTLYPEIFNDALDIDTFLLAYLAYAHVYKYSTKMRSKFTFANYSEFHTVALLKKLGVNDMKTFQDTDHVNELIDKILKVTDKVVKEEIDQKGDKYSHRAFFINPSLLGRIEEALI